MSDQLSTADILRKAADLIEPEGAWIRGELALTTAGRVIGPMEVGAACWCAVGAIERAGGGGLDELTGDGIAALRALEAVVGGYVPPWNDAPERTQAEVVAALRLAAVRCDGGDGVPVQLGSPGTTPDLPAPPTLQAVEGQD